MSREVIHYSHWRCRHRRFHVAPNNKSKGQKSGDREGPATSQPRSSPPFEMCRTEVVTHCNLKMCWCTIMYELFVLALYIATTGEVGILYRCRFFRPYHGSLNPNIRLATSLVQLIGTLTAIIIAILTGLFLETDFPVYEKRIYFGYLLRGKRYRTLNCNKTTMYYSIDMNFFYSKDNLVALHLKYDFWHMTASAGSDVVQSGRPIFDDICGRIGRISAITRRMLSSKWSSVCGLAA
ncbi:adhesion G protein-coupled receptor B2 [Trichonephila clavipes]|nr:adhesion G protein-coupled receptor B2 [Trichonephila clavipes]